MDQLPEEIQNEIILRVPRSSLLRVSQVCTLWKRYALKRVIIPQGKNYKRKLRQLCHDGDFLSLGLTDRVPDYLMRYFAEAGNHKMVSRLFGISTDQYGPGGEHYPYGYTSIDHIMMGACRGGHLDLAKWAVSHGALTCELPCEQAGKGGHREIIEWLISNHRIMERNLCEGLAGGGHLEILEWLQQEHPGSLILDTSLSDACRYHQTEVIDWLLQEGIVDFDEGLCGAALGGHKDLIDSMIARGGDNLNGALTTACIKKNREIFDFIAEKGATFCSFCAKRPDEHTF